MKRETIDRLQMVSVWGLLGVVGVLTVALIYKNLRGGESPRIQSDSNQALSVLAQGNIPSGGRWTATPKLFLIQLGDQKVVVAIYRDSISVCPSTEAK